MNLQRLQKVIATSGLCSRRQAESLIKEGQVKVNGNTASLGDCVHLTDCIEVNGKQVQIPSYSTTLLVNKPIGVISTCKDPQGRPTILDLIPECVHFDQRLYPIGRLDSNTRGALLLTTNGDLTLQLTHPRYSHRKVYRVWIDGHLNTNTLKKWQAGVFLNGELTNKVDIEIERMRKNATLVRLTMTEGRKRQIRQTAALLGHPVLDLQRVSINSIDLGSLPEGYWRALTFAEWSGLLEGG